MHSNWNNVHGVDEDFSEPRVRREQDVEHAREAVEANEGGIAKSQRARETVLQCSMQNQALEHEIASLQEHVLPPKRKTSDKYKYTLEVSSQHEDCVQNTCGTWRCNP
jgi:hypothetical protein